MATTFRCNHEAYMAYLDASRLLADAVGMTFGPRGGNVLMERHGSSPRVTRDGMLVAGAVRSQAPFTNMVLQVLRSSAGETAESMGDGATTTVLLACALLQRGVKLLASGYDPVALGRELAAASRAASSALERAARPVDGPDEAARIAGVAAGDDDLLGHRIADALAHAGSDGDVSVQEADECGLDRLEACCLRARLHLARNADTPGVHLDGANVLLYDGMLAAGEGIDVFADAVAAAGCPVIALSRDAGPELGRWWASRWHPAQPPVAFFVLEGVEHDTRVLLDDLAALTDARVLCAEAGERWPASLAPLGHVARASDHRGILRLTGGRGTATSGTASRIASVRDHLRDQPVADRETLYQRIGRLRERMAVIRLHAPTASEADERHARIDSGVCALRAALAGGVVPGGGIGLLRATTFTDDQPAGARILGQAAGELVVRLADNAGHRGTAILEKVRAAPGSVGFNARTGTIEDLEAAGVVDPASVTRIALQRATAAAASLLLSGGLLARHP